MAEFNFSVDSTALEVIRNTDLKANFKEAKAFIVELVKPYKNAVVTEDGVAGAKADRARLNKIGKQIDDYRKMVKKTYNEPLKIFEEGVKELTGEISDASANLDRQVKIFEEAKKEAKMLDLRNYFEEHEKQHPDYISWGQIMDERWGNATFDVEEAQTRIDQAIKDSDTAVNTILALGSEFEVSVLNEYKQTHDIYRALNLNSQLIETAKRRKEQEERMIRMREEQRIREEAIRRKQAEQAAEVKAQLEQEMQADPKSFDSEEPVVVQKKLLITATADAFKELEEYMMLHFISWKEL